MRPLVLGHGAQQANVTTSRAPAVKEVPYTFTALPAMLHHVPQALALGQGTGGTSKGTANMDLEPPRRLLRPSQAPCSTFGPVTPR